MGGRFVEGFAGEQFAHKDAVAGLKRARQDKSHHVVILSACDPLNLSGVITAGKRHAALSGHRIAWQNGGGDRHVRWQIHSHR